MLGSSRVHCVHFMMHVLSCSCMQVLWQVDSILFCLLVLQGVCDSQGNVWRCHPAHLYMIESTIPKVGAQIDRHTTRHVTLCTTNISYPCTQGGELRAASHTIALYKLLPSVECVSPRYLHATEHLQGKNISLYSLSPRMSPCGIVCVSVC